MIIDSPAHYSRGRFDEYFRYLTLRGGGYAIGEGTGDARRTARTACNKVIKNCDPEDRSFLDFHENLGDSQ